MSSNRLEDYDISHPVKAAVIANELITPPGAEVDVHRLVLEFERGDLEFSLGQSLGVLAPGSKEFGTRHHLRLFSLAGIEDVGSKIRVEICVRRCFYIDEFSGERYQGVASNYLCDRKPADKVTITGPYGAPFEVPEDKKANILMIGLGTGIAPFRVFVQRLYEQSGAWKGKVRLFYGAKSGLELVYMNDVRNDFANYYDEPTFKAFESVSVRPHLDESIPLDRALEQNREEVWNMILQPDTHVYVAGLEKVNSLLEKAFIAMAGSEDKWRRRKAELVAGGRWTELIY